MRCPKCGYVSFDSNLECPKCQSDISTEQSKLHLPSFKPFPPFFFGDLVGNEEEVDFDRADGIQGSYGSSDSSSRAIKDIEEIKELISELMPAKSDTEPD